MKFGLFRSRVGQKGSPIISSPDQLFAFFIYAGAGTLVWWKMKTPGALWQWTVPVMLLTYPTRLHPLGFALFGAGITVMAISGTPAIPDWLIFLLAIATGVGAAFRNTPPDVPEDVQYNASKGTNAVPWIYAGMYTLSLLVSSVSVLHPTWVTAIVSASFIFALPMERGRLVLPMILAASILLVSMARFVLIA